MLQREAHSIGLALRADPILPLQARFALGQARTPSCRPELGLEGPDAVRRRVGGTASDDPGPRRCRVSLGSGRRAEAYGQGQRGQDGHSDLRVHGGVSFHR